MALPLEPDGDWDPAQDPSPSTRFFKDATSTIINYNDSPDVGFNASVNPYRGCEHGCIYCYARPTHEYLGFSAGLDFESRIMVKENAPELLRRELASPKWRPQVLAFSGVTDCYQPVERKLKLTRRCLEVLAEFRNPVAVVTKNHLVTRDIDVLIPQVLAFSGVTDCYQPVERKLKLTRRCLEVLAEFRNPVGVVTKNHLVTRDIDVLGELARHQAAAVFMSLTTLDSSLTPKLEPRASLPNHRLGAIEALRGAGVPVGVLLAPMIPGLNDHEIPSLLNAAAKAGAQFAGYVVLRLPFGLGNLFEEWLTQHFPERKEKILNRIRALRGGRLNDPNFGSRMRGEGSLADQIEALFLVSCRKAGFGHRRPELSAAAFRVPASARAQQTFSF